MFSESIVTIVETIQFFPKDKTCLGFSRAENLEKSNKNPNIIQLIAAVKPQSNLMVFNHTRQVTRATQ